MAGQTLTAEQVAVATARKRHAEARRALRRGNTGAAARLARAGLRMRPRSIELLLVLAEALAAERHLTEAWAAARRARELAPARYEPVRLLAAIAHARGDETVGHRAARTYFKAHPYHRPRTGPAAEAAPTLLRARGTDRADFTLGRLRGDALSVRFRGGHFSLRYLIDWAGWHVVSGYLVGDNWQRMPPPEDTALIVNTIADADREPGALDALARFHEARPDLPILNHPERIADTARERNAERLAGRPGFRVPKAVRIAVDGRAGAALADAVEAAGIGWPAILRETGTQTARTVERVDDRAVAERYLAAVSPDAEVYAIEFVENADPEGWYTKRRLFFIDGDPFPVVTHTDAVWNVHGGNRRTVMAQHPWMTDRERAFLRDPKAQLGADAFAALTALPELVGLDFFGIDFTILPGGEILFFEMNAAMRHSFDHAVNFPYMRPHMRRIGDAFDAMCRRRAGVG